MSRSSFKSPIYSLKKETNKKVSKIFNKNFIILPDDLNLKFKVYNGKRFVMLVVNENMIGKRFGEFIYTRVANKYKKKK